MSLAGCALAQAQHERAASAGAWLYMKILEFIHILIPILLLSPAGCKQPLSENDQYLINEIASHRREVDSTFRFDPNSPFNQDTTIHFEGIKWFPPDVRYYFKSKLYRYDPPETVIVLGTKGEERKQLKYGYFLLKFDGKDHKLNAYKFTASEGERYEMYRNLLSVWFTDETTGKETYQVGRYVEVGDENPFRNFEYTINLNNAYNPYCAYSANYSCAIPRREDHLDFAVMAGELKYH